MIINCPHCNSNYEIEKKLLSQKGRKVKCFSCSSRQSEDWFHCKCTAVRLLRCSVISSEKIAVSFLQLAPESSEAKA